MSADAPRGGAPNAAADAFYGADPAVQAPADAPATPSALERVRTLRGVTWEWRPGTEAIHGSARTRQMGVIAQDVAKAFPEAVVVHEPSGTLMVDYAGLVGALIEAVKELADRVEQLERAEREGTPQG